MDVKALAEQAGKSGSVPDPELVKVEIQVRTGTMFPLPSWHGRRLRKPQPTSSAPKNER